MCGIAGIYDPRRVDQADRLGVKRMIHAMLHRGPDGSGLAADRDVCLGVVRLAMVDSARPIDVLRNEDGSILLVYNGEIYNHHSLRRRLEGRGHVFRTRSDGEVIVHLYEDLLDPGLLLLDGMFAFALWDAKNRRFVLARDHLGIKPLYYQRRGQRVAFASELKALVAADPERPDLDAMALMDYYHYRFVSAPRTIFAGISKLAPGSTLLATEDGIVVSRYWSPRFGANPHSRPFGESFRRAVNSTAAADHAVGVLLSGGLDSSAILATRASSVEPPLAFTIGYQGAGRGDERSAARAVARHLGVRNIHRELADDEVHDTLRAALWHLDEPLYSTVSVSTFALAELAARSVKGVMTGDGADELLLGYPYLLPVREAVRRRGDWRAVYKEQIGWLSAGHRDLLLVEPRGRVGNVFLDLDHDELPLEVVRSFELRYRLPEYHLTRVDRLTMAHGLEARVPFLRHEIVDGLCGRRAEDLLAPRRQKAILRQAFSALLPASALTRRKQPFTAPHASWLSGPLRPHARRLILESGHHEKLGLRRESLERLLADFYDGKEGLLSAVWGVYVLFEWFQGIAAGPPSLLRPRERSRA